MISYSLAWKFDVSLNGTWLNHIEFESKINCQPIVDIINDLMYIVDNYTLSEHLWR